MAEIIKLNAARKKIRRATKEKLAQANRVKFGRTKAEKNLAKAKKQRAASLLDGHRLKE